MWTHHAFSSAPKSICLSVGSCPVGSLHALNSCPSWTLSSPAVSMPTFSLKWSLADPSLKTLTAGVGSRDGAEIGAQIKQETKVFPHLLPSPNKHLCEMLQIHSSSRAGPPDTILVRVYPPKASVASQKRNIPEELIAHCKGCNSKCKSKIILPT